MSAAEELRRPRRDAARRPTARHSAADPSDKDPVASSTPAINTNIEEVFLRLNDTRPIPVHWAHRTTPFTHPRSMALSSLHLTLRTNILCYKTTDIVAIMCLNLGVDPPDCIKPVDCPKLEAWINPHQLPNSYTHNGDQRNSLERARDLIGKSLQQQFSSLQSQRLAVHMLMDPAIEVIQRKCARIQRGNHGRVVFYYNGHGVPRPTSNGDIWAFDEAFEQYIPASAADVRDWMPSPAVFIWECANAQTVMEAVMRVTSQRAAAARNSENPDAMMYKQGQMSDSSLLEDIHFAATSHRELLPTNPEIPVDLFTSCLTTPIRIALRFWVTQNPDSGITMDMVDNLPGPLSDRRTPLGEINWIFVTITDTIAWTVLPRKVFYKLFRQDVLVSTLLRNYLLAERVMRYYGRHPTCSPSLPLTHKHPLWEKWDMEVSLCLGQLPKLLKAERWRKHVEKVQKKRQERQKEWEEIMRGRMHHTVPEADTASSDESPRINLKL
ncbi:Target of rapamycin complex 1 subunit kog1, partial [Spiromyces aspiralis]